MIAKGQNDPAFSIPLRNEESVAGDLRHQVFCGVLLVIATFTLAGPMSGQETGGNMAEVEQSPSRITVTNEAAGVRIVIPQRRIWLYIVLCGVPAVLFAYFTFVVLRAMVLDREFSLFGIAMLLLVAFFALGLGYGLLWFAAGRDVLQLGPGSLCIRTEIVGVGISAPTVYSSPIKDVRVEAQVIRSRVSDEFKQVEVDFEDGDRATLQNFMNATEANLVADAIKKRAKRSERK